MGRKFGTLRRKWPLGDEYTGNKEVPVRKIPHVGAWSASDGMPHNEDIDFANSGTLENFYGEGTSFCQYM